MNQNHTSIAVFPTIRIWLIVKLSLCTLCICLMTSPGLFAQATGEQIEDAIERVVSEFDPETSDIEITQLIEHLRDLASNPVNINRAGMDELANVPGLNLRLAQSVIRYRETIKPFESVSELLNVEGIGEATFTQVRPFVSAGNASERRSDLYLNPKFWTFNGRAESLSSLQRVTTARAGYNRPDSLGGYIGSPVKLNHRLRYRSDHLSINLTQDKDPGEQLTGLTGFDFTSWHVALEDAGLIQNLVIGDYKVSYGQGLTLWNGGAFGKSSSVMGAASKSDPGIRPYTSTQETNGFRGIAATAGNRLQFSGFYSNRLRSASDADSGYVRFPSSSGLHRTESEKAKRLNLRQKTFGGRIRYQFGRGVAGISGFQNIFNRPVQKGTQPYQLHDVEGTELAVIGTDIRLTIGSALVFGELARSSNKSFGGITGVEIQMIEGTDLAVAYRNYARDFHSIFGSGFGEQSGTQNETGVFTGIRQGIGGRAEINAYIDFFQTHGPRFGNNRPTSGTDWLIRLDADLNRELSFYLQLRSKYWEQQFESADNFGRTVDSMGFENRSNIRLHFEYNVLDNLRLRSRFDIIQYRETASSPSLGYLIYQDIRFLPIPSLTIDARITLFETDDFNSRVFQFENDLLYVMSNTMLYDQGQRSYLVLRYQPFQSLTLRLKASTTLYENKQVIGSGLDMITGSRKTDIGLQIQLKL